MATPASPKLTFVRGDDETVILQIDSDDSGTAVNITGRTYVMSVGTAASPLQTATGTVVGATGTVTFVFTDTQTDALTGSSYSYDVVETASGSESTLLLGSLDVRARVAA